MNYAEIRVEVPAAQAEALSAFLWDEGLGFQEADQTTLDPPPPGRVRFHLFVAPADSEAVLSSLRAALPRPDAAELSLRERDEDEWRDAWKRHFTTRRLGRIAIVPSWEAAGHVPGTGEVTLHLDPGRAFGTGGHASTRLCLRMIDRICVGPDAGPILDVGCGCGVLAIAALLLSPGARGLAVDIDPEALEVTAENAARNGVTERLEIAGTKVQEVPGRFGLVLANLSGPTLHELAQALAARLAPGGSLVVSGILSSEAPGIAARMRGLGLHLCREETEEEWSALRFSAERPGR